MAFISVSEFLKRYDARVIGDLVSDSDSRVSSGSLSSDANLAAALNDAAGEILLAAQRGERYSEADLTNLTGISAAILYRLNADLAVECLAARRGLPIEQYPKAVKAREILDQIEKGERIFGKQEAAEAGHAQSPDIDWAVVFEEQGLRDTSRLFPIRRMDY